MSEEIFGYVKPANKNNPALKLDRVYKRAAINLGFPLPNYIITGKGNTDLLRKLFVPSLIQKREHYIGIMSYNMAFNTMTGEIESLSEKSRENYLFGAQYLKYLLETKVENKFNHWKNSVLNSATNMTLTTVENDYHIIGDYYLDVPSEISQEYYQSKLDNIMEINRGPLSFILNMQSVQDVYDLFLELIFVTPPDLRPNFMRAKDSITTKYSTIIEKSNQVKNYTFDNNTTVTFYAQSLRALDNAYQALITDNITRKPNEKTLEKKNSSKEGRIRKNMLAKVVDYSGRSAIIVDPELHVDEIGLPVEMILEIFKSHLVKYKSASMTPEELFEDKELCLKLFKDHISGKVPVMLNRPPTLHRLSWRAFYVVPNDGMAIKLNPLVCAGFNADFDGDAMAVHVPLTDKAIREVKELMLSTANIFVPGSGEHTLVPKQDMIYGLNIMSKRVDLNGKVLKSYTDENDLIEDFLAYNIPSEVLVKYNGKVETLGRHIIKEVLMADLNISDDYEEITKDSIIDLMNNVLNNLGLSRFKNFLYECQYFGFNASELYAPSISILDDITNDALNQPFKDYHSNLENVNELYRKGLEDDVTYNRKVDNEFQKVEKNVRDNIEDALGPDNGFLRFVKAGARGTKDNLVQIYGYKGRIQKNNNEVFRAIIEKSFSDQLSPLEHFQSAYGTRTGMMEKVQKTADTGYMNRLVYQAASDLMIRHEDCQTREGIELDLEIFKEIMNAETKTSQDVIDSFTDAIKGKYLAKRNTDFKISHAKIWAEAERNGLYITTKLANLIVNEVTCKIRVRSPLTCEHSCCSKCYGDDLTLRGPAVVGTPVGLIAGQSIGEPGTQLVMKSFHKGGVAGKATMSTDFDRMWKLVENTNVSREVTYSPIAWATGKVIYKRQLDCTEVMIEGHDKKVKIHNNEVKLKKEVTKGEVLTRYYSEVNYDEMVKYLGLTPAITKLAIKMYLTYYGKATVNFKHFEALVTEMVRYRCLKVPEVNDTFKVGGRYSRYQVRNLGDDYKLVPELVGVKGIQTGHSDPLNALLMEHFKAGIQRSVYQQTISEVDTTMGQMLLSEKVTNGTGLNYNYITERKEAFNKHGKYQTI